LAVSPEPERRSRAASPQGKQREQVERGSKREFEFKEHILAMGLGLLPAYWYFWQQPQSMEHATVRKWLTIFLAVSVWYGFVSGHIANDFRGIGS
jgi:hypothetical protein